MKKNMAAFLFPAPTLLLLLSVCVFQPGCVGGSVQSETIQYYMPEYESPGAKTLRPLPYILHVRLFSAAPPYRSDKMFYSDKKFKKESYNYHKWRSKPGDIATYLLTRDLRNSALFGGVFFYDEESSASHFLSGIVDDFYGLESHDVWKAVFAISATLLADGASDAGEKICRQKTYRAEKECRAKNPYALAEAMSLAISAVSEMIILDVYDCLKNEKSAKSRNNKKSENN